MVSFRKTLYLWARNFCKCVLHKVLRSRKTYVFYLIAISVFIVEIVIYYSVTFLWYRIECSNKNECVKILLVADPQLIGFHNEPIPMITPLSIWDSDRFLSKTFSQAYKFCKPDIVIFLGDLFDEGSSANDNEFEKYQERFYNIFQEPKDSVEHIWIPGDNDIGGEFPDFITYHKIERFNQAFSQPDIIPYKKFNFYKVNRLNYQIPAGTQYANLTNVNVVLSHLPLLVTPTLFVDKVLDAIHPKLIFTAHTHKSMIVTTREETRKDRFISPIRPDNTEVYIYDLKSNNIVEVVVPTCSYRMGTDKIAYGFAVLESNTLRYTVLWSPSRFPQLIIYGIVCIILSIYVLCACIRNKTVQYTSLQPIV